MAVRRRFLLAAPVVQRPAAEDPGSRPPTPADAPALAALMWAAFRGGLDDEGESPDDAGAQVRRLFDGDCGPVLWAASEVTTRGGRLASATLLTRFEGHPFVAFVLTAPAHRRRGLARAGLQRAINRLAAAGEPVVRLVLTQGNRAAEQLYEGLGFRPEARPPFVTG